MLAELRMTRVFAAHRPDTIRIADRVITLSRSGKIFAEPAGKTTAGAAVTDLYQGETHAHSK
jgi:ABC-type bacteriocin/lantibiotic exporter with double-glycine peptidase domain